MTDRTAYVDWPRLLGDIAYLLGEPDFEGSALRVAVGTPALAKHLDVKRTTLVGWMEGAEPKYRQGCELIRAWSALTGKRIEFVPITVGVVLSAAKVR